MKKTTILFTAAIGIIAFASCSSKKDCVCVTTNTVNGVVTSTSTSSTSNSTGGGPAVNNAVADNCDAGDYYYSSTNSQGQTVIDETACENE